MKSFVIRSVVAALLLTGAAWAQVPQAPPYPAPDDRYKADILVIVAHPDDDMAAAESLTQTRRVHPARFELSEPAFAYLLIWLSIRMPRRLHAIGRKNDYSYGIYIYGFVAQQVMASYNLQRFGFLPFAGVAIVAAFALAFCSWHVVEKRALRLKGWAPPLPWRRRAADGSTQPEAAVADVPPAAEGDPSTPDGKLVPVPSKA